MPRPRYHTGMSLVLAALCAWRRWRFPEIAGILIGGVLVDVDHLVQLVVNRRGQIDFHVVPLHGWEWVFLLLRGNRFARGLATGLAAHLALDQFNPAIRHPLFYWVAVRGWYLFRAVPQLVDREIDAREAVWMRAAPWDWF